MENKKFLEGEVVCVSGKFDNLTQEEMESLVTKNGGTVSSSVTKKTTMLVTGDKVGATKLAKATELGIRIVDQNMFFLCLDDDSADNDSAEKEMSASVSSNKHSISMSFHCPYLDFWGLSLHKKEDLQAFVKEYSEEDVVDLDDPDFYIENVSEFFDKYGYPDSYNIFNELDEIWVSIDGERRTNYTESYKNGLDSGAIKVQESTTKLQTNGADYCCKSNLGNKTVMFEVQFEIEGDFDINKLGVCQEIIEYSKKQYTEINSKFYYDGNELNLEMGYSDGRSMDVFLYKVEKTDEQKDAKITLSSEPGISISENTIETDIERLVIPNSVTTIKSSLFNGCTNLKSVVIPASVTSIEVFPYMMGDIVFEVEETNPSYSSVDGFLLTKDQSCLIRGNSFARIPDSVTSIGIGAFTGCRGLENLVIPDSVTSIGIGAFADCESLKNVVISKNVLSIESSAFDYNVEITFDVDPQNQFYASVDGMLLSKDKTVLFRGNSFARIPDCVTSIENHAFEGCRGLENLVIPDSVTSIGIGAFADCESLKNVVISKNVLSIESATFKNCKALKNINIPASVKHIDFLLTPAFDFNVEITFDVDPQNQFYASVDGMLLSKDKTVLFRGNSFAAIPDSVKEIQRKAFFECKNLLNVTIPATMKSIGPEAFCGCSGLRSISILGTGSKWGVARELDTGVFAKCTSLSEVSISAVVKRIPSNAFEGCTSLVNFTIPDTVTEIGENAFLNCTSLSNVVFPESITTIKRCAFGGCTGLVDVTIPASVKTIEPDVFTDCDNMKSITIPKSLKKWASCLNSNIQVTYKG